MHHGCARPQRAVCHSLQGGLVLSTMRPQAHSAPGKAIKRHRIAAGLVPCLVGACLCTARAAAPDVVTFNGICDASAAIALDADRIIVGDDEKPFLSIYG